MEQRGGMADSDRKACRLSLGSAEQRRRQKVSAPRILIEVSPLRLRGLAATTWEQRRRLSAAELIRLMGPLHVNHPEYQPRPHTLLPVPNLAGCQPVFSCYDLSIWGQIKMLLRWIAQ